MGCIIKKIFFNEIDESVHRQFVRFGKGSYRRRAVLVLNKTSKIKMRGSFEYANDFVEFAAEFPANFSGIISSKEKLDLENEKRKNGLYSYEVEHLTSEQIREMKNKIYYMLLDSDSEEIKLKIKKKLPKLGKSGEQKIDEKFCQLEADLKFWEKIKEEFFWDCDGKKIKAEHSYLINELIVPKDEKNFELLRLETKRKGKLIRKLEIDSKTQEIEKEFEV